MVSNPNGLHRPFSHSTGKPTMDNHNLFQTQTGSTGHLAPLGEATQRSFQFQFQTQTGSTGHLANSTLSDTEVNSKVSNPNGLHRPFSLYRHFEIPNYPDLFQTQTGSTGHLASFAYIPCGTTTVRFKPKRAPQAI